MKIDGTSIHGITFKVYDFEGSLRATTTFPEDAVEFAAMLGDETTVRVAGPTSVVLWTEGRETLDGVTLYGNCRREAADVVLTRLEEIKASKQRRAERRRAKVVSAATAIATQFKEPEPKSLE